MNLIVYSRLKLTLVLVLSLTGCTIEFSPTPLDNQFTSQAEKLLQKHGVSLKLNKPEMEKTYKLYSILSPFVRSDGRLVVEGPRFGNNDMFYAVGCLLTAGLICDSPSASMRIRYMREKDECDLYFMPYYDSVSGWLMPIYTVLPGHRLKKDQDDGMFERQGVITMFNRMAEDFKRDFSHTTKDCYPDSPDSDRDGFSDAYEAKLGTNPLRMDTDDDGLSDGHELNIIGSNPLMKDSDHDGISDRDEYFGLK